MFSLGFCLSSPREKRKERKKEDTRSRARYVNQGQQQRFSELLESNAAIEDNSNWPSEPATRIDSIRFTPDNVGPSIVLELS
jgi:hypothetical protein